LIATRPLPGCGLALSPLGLGTAALGDLDDDAAAVATIVSALDRGVTYLDTAPHYGIGHAERRTGAALDSTAPGSRPPRDTSGRPLVLSTKVGRVIDERSGTEAFDFSASGVRASLEASLRRLGVEKPDILFLHDPDHAEEQAVAEAFPALRELRADGVVTAIGAGMNQAPMLERFVANPRIGLDIILLAGRYTLLDTSGLRLLDLCHERGVGVVIGGAFNSGILAAPTDTARYDYRAAPPALIERGRRLAAVCERHGVPLPAAALQFGWGHPAVVSVLNGPGSQAQLTANLGYATLTIPAACWEQLRSAGLLAEGVPVPGER
jgi:D-threo-aldose 1-dehydrogenase